MNPLRQRMLEDMQLRNFSAETQRSYIHYVADYARHYNLSPVYLGLDDIRNYQLYLIEQRRLSPESVNTFVSAARFFYTVTLDMPWSTAHFTRMKTPEKRPVILSAEEVVEFFRADRCAQASSGIDALLRLGPANQRGRRRENLPH